MTSSKTLNPLPLQSAKPTLDPSTDLLSPKEGGALLGMHPISLRRYRHQGILDAYRLPGGRIRYSRVALLALLEPAIG
jgi:hypothetical protein